MTAKEFLMSASELNQQIHYKEIELKSLRDLANGVSDCNFDEHLSGTRNPDPPFVRYTDKALALEKEIQNDKCKLSALKYSIEKAIQSFSENWTPQCTAVH